MLTHERVEIGDEILAPHGITNVVVIELTPPAVPRPAKAYHNPRVVKLSAIRKLNKKLRHKRYDVMIGVSPTAEWRKLFPGRTAMYFNPKDLYPM